MAQDTRPLLATLGSLLEFPKLMPEALDLAHRLVGAEAFGLGLAGLLGDLRLELMALPPAFLERQEGPAGPGIDCLQVGPVLEEMEPRHLAGQPAVDRLDRDVTSFD